MSAARTLAVAATRTSFTAPPSTFVRTRPFLQAFSLSRPLQLQSNPTFSSHGTLFSPTFTLRHSRGMCQLAQAIKGDVDDLLKSVVDKNVVEEVKHILEMDNDGEDMISNLRNGAASENAVAIMQEKGFSNPRSSRHRLTPGTVKFAAFHVLSLEGSKGLTILDVADKIQKSGLRDLTTSNTPEASIAAALSRDSKLFERTAPSTYGVRPAYRKDLADVEARRVSSRRDVVHTDFLTPPVLKDSMIALEKLADVKTVAQGGYPQAERCRISVGHPEALTSDPDVVAALSITGNFGFQPCSHGDFLGAILGAGIAREKLGDIILQGEKGAQILVVPELVDYLISSLDKVGNVSVSCAKIPLLALEYEPPRTNSFKAIEASLRVDALASAGFKISRSKLVNLISNGDVRVNWNTVTKNGTTLKTGDIVSVSGKGRLKIGEINRTKKGKFAVELVLYL